MATRTYINGNPQILRQVLEDSGYFDSVKLETESGDAFIKYDSKSYHNLITCTAASGEHTAELRIGQLEYISHRDSFDIRFENTNGIKERWYNGEKSSNNTLRTVLFPVESYQCEGGLAIVMTNARMLITKSNLGEVVVVLTTSNMKLDSASSGLTVDTVAQQITPYATSDIPPVLNCPTNVAVGTQTLLIPICTNANFDKPSYTVTAFWQAYKQYKNIGYLIYNGKRYFSDGYFAIEDTEAEEA